MIAIFKCFVLLTTISATSDAALAFTPFAQLDITDEVNTKIIEIGRDQNVDFFFPDASTANSEPSADYLKNAESTGIVAANTPLKSPAGVIWMGVNITNKSESEVLFIHDFEYRSADTLAVYQMTPNGEFSRLELTDEPGVRHAGKALKLKIPKGQKTTIYVRIKSKSYQRLSLGIGTEPSLGIFSNNWTFSYGILTSLTIAALALYCWLLWANRDMVHALAFSRFILIAIVPVTTLGIDRGFFNIAMHNIPTSFSKAAEQLGSLLFISFICATFDKVPGFAPKIKLARSSVGILLASELILVAFTTMTYVDVSTYFALGQNAIAMAILTFLWIRHSKFASLHLAGLTPIVLYRIYEIMGYFWFYDVGQFTRMTHNYFLLASAILCAVVMMLQYFDQRQTDAKIEVLSEEGSALKSLIKTLAHDLATPISNISASVVAARKILGADSNARNELGFIERSAGQLTEIIDHVRKTEAIRDGKLKVELVSVQLLDVFDSSRSIFERKLQEKGVELLFDRERVGNYSVMAERTSLIHSVINNILSNSIKFSEKGSQITLSAEATTDERVCVTIQDQGIGIPKNILPVLFSSTAKTSRTGTSGETGTGYGMPLVKAYVGLFGGTIEVESVTKDENPARHGTTFRLIFNPGAAKYRI
jgi:signal transduction histidine kinase